MSEVAKLESINGARVPTAGTLSGLFVINLCASMTPMPAVPKTLKGFEKYKLYQVSRQEDGRRRFRLRLGFFTSEADAEWVLNSVRNLYPAAFTGCVSQEDLRHTGDIPAAMKLPAPGFAPEPAAVNSVVDALTKKSSPVVVPKEFTPVEVKPAEISTLTPINKASAVTTTSKAQANPQVSPQSNLSLATPLPTPTAPQNTGESKDYPPVFHVARGIEVPETSLELTDEYPSLTTTPARPAGKPTAAKIAPASSAQSKPGTGGARVPPIHSASLVNPPKIHQEYVPILDTTLTIRTLTKSEAEDPNRPKWFVVQLAVSEQPINLDTMPKLDIFAAYSLYCVALMESGSIKHALRLGFFRESVSADAVMGYLKAFFSTPAVTQISAAEQERFAEAKPKPQPAVEAEKVVNLNDKRPSSKPAAVMATATPPTVPKSAPHKPVTRATKPKDKINATRPPSFLSRLIGRQLD